MTSGIREYVLAVIIVAASSGISLFLTDFIGYQSVSLILLFTVSILSIFLGIGPVTLAAVLSALIWNFFFIPPKFTISIERTEDALMLGMFFIIALVNGILNSRIRRQERLARKARFLDESDKLYKTLFNSISHELRIPVAAIMSASESLQEAVHSEDIRKELSGEILKASKRLNRLIENLLNMSRLESGHLTPKPDWCDIHDLVNKVTDDLIDELRPFNLRVDIPDEMPLVRIDFGLMEQVLYNLVFNATQHSAASSVIEIRVRRPGEFMTVEVMDQGPGFPVAELPYIFDKFYRAEGSKAGGTGLGLSIAKGFTEAHRGMIRAENIKGGGAKITIEIPSEMPEVDIETNQRAKDELK